MSTRLQTADNLFDYFRLRVEEARAERGIELSDDTVLYLAQLLAERARTDREAPRAHTLAELHAAAVEAAPAEQARHYRELGDRALHDLGYFTEHLEGGLVSLDYYEAMGRSAYARVDQVMERWFARAFGDLFRELAAGFCRAVDLLAQVREAHERHDDLGELYAEWLQTGSEELAARLRSRGLVIPRTRPSEA